MCLKVSTEVLISESRLFYGGSSTMTSFETSISINSQVVWDVWNNINISEFMKSIKVLSRFVNKILHANQERRISNDYVLETLQLFPLYDIKPFLNIIYTYEA